MVFASPLEPLLFDQVVPPCFLAAVEMVSHHGKEYATHTPDTANSKIFYSKRIENETEIATRGCEAVAVIAMGLST